MHYIAPVLYCRLTRAIVAATVARTVASDTIYLSVQYLDMEVLVIPTLLTDNVAVLVLSLRQLLPDIEKLSPCVRDSLDIDFHLVDIIGGSSSTLTFTWLTLSEAHLPRMRKSAA